MIYLYAITEAAAEPPACRGLQDAPVRLARSAEVAGLYSSHETIGASPEPEALWCHERVVEAAMEAAPTLPARFGTTFADEAALGVALEREGKQLSRQLRRLRGCVELAVRVGLENERSEAPTDGRAYLEAKLARVRRQRAVARETLAPLAELAVQMRSLDSSSDGELLCASYLVRREAVEDFAERVRLIAQEAAGLWVSCTGPWPPYSFAGLEEAA